MKPLLPYLAAQNIAHHIKNNEDVNKLKKTIRSGVDKVHNELEVSFKGTLVAEKQQN